MAFEGPLIAESSGRRAGTSHTEVPEATAGLAHPLASSDDPPPQGFATRDPGGRGRRGAAAVEFAVVAPLLFLVIFGIIEFGRMMMVQQILTNASREGARRAILEQATEDQVEAVVGDYLAGASISGANVTISPSDLKSIGFGDPVTVTVSVPYDRVSWLPSSWFFRGTTLTAQSVMRGERPE